MKSEREYNYDLLRVVSMIAVIMIHVSAIWIKVGTKHVANGGEISELVNPVMTCIYNTISRFAVPCFIMLSGAFILDNKRTANYQEFYQKEVVKIGVPTIIFSILYVLYRIIFVILYALYDVFGLCTQIDWLFTDLMILIRDVVMGSPFYHMWYLYMLIGVYLMAPIVVRFKDSISYGNFRKIVFIFLIWASISRWTTDEVRLSWDLGQAFEYLGYFMTGYVVRKDLSKNNFKGILLIVLGVIIEIATAFAEYKFQIVNGIAEDNLVFEIVSPYCPTIILASLLIFAGFTMLQIRYSRWIEKLAEMSFFVYLFHAGVWDFFLKFVNLIKDENYIMKLNSIYWIPIFVAMVFIVSILLTIIYNKLEFRFLRRKHIK